MGLSSLFVKHTDDGFLFKVKVTLEELSVMSFVTCVLKVRMLQVTKLKILIRISLSHCWSYSFTWFVIK